MQNYLVNIVVQSNLWTIFTFSFRKKKTDVLVSSGFGSGLCLFLSAFKIITYCLNKNINLRCILMEGGNMTIVNKCINVISRYGFTEYMFRLCFTGKNFDFLLKFSVYIQYHLPVLTMFPYEWNNILDTYLDFSPRSYKRLLIAISVKFNISGNCLRGYPHL